MAQYSMLGIRFRLDIIEPVIFMKETTDNYSGV